MMKNIAVAGTLLINVFFHVNQSFAQTLGAPEKYVNTIVEEDLKKHLFELASDAYEGRETGQPGQKKAAEYLANYYRDLNVAPCVNGSYFQSYPLKKVTYTTSTIENNGTTFKFKDDFFFFGSDAVAPIEADVVFVGYGIDDSLYSDYNNVDVNGKIVICLSGEPTDKNGNSIFTGNTSYTQWTEDFRTKVDVAQNKGASAILMADAEYENYLPRIRYWLDQPRLTLDYPTNPDDATLPYAMISNKMADQILSASKKKSVVTYRAKINKKKKTVTVPLKVKIKFNTVQDATRVTAENVLAFIEGSDPKLKKEVVVVSAHYDHIGIVNGEINNGADDDGSGTVSAMEIAQAFVSAKNDGQGPRRSVLVLHVSGEEKGLLGSEWYSEFPIFPLANTVCDLNIDMIGRVDEQHKDNDNYVYVIGSDKLSTTLHSISENTNKERTQLELDYTYNDPEDPNRFYYRSDHYNFAKHDIPVIFYFSGVHEDYHQPGDDAEKIHFGKMVTIAKLVFHTAWEVANRDERLKVDVISDFK
jgi:hypothetical protein